MNLGQIVLNEIGLDGLVYLAAQKYLLKEKGTLIHPTISHTSQYIAFVLLQKNRVFGIEHGEVKTILNKLGILEECKRKFKKLR